jgi:polysaccharide export outer membrane protein
MKLVYSIPFLLVLVFFSACTSTKSINYLQDNKSDNIKAEELIKTMRLQESQYKLQPADRLLLNVFTLTDEQINFLKKPDLELVLDSKGQVEVPVIGLVTISGLTIREAEQKLKTVMAEYLKSPSVTIKLMNFNVTVIGEVGNQGTFLATEPKVNILEAIGKAGGLSENANLGNVRIVRSENNTAKIYRINLLEDNSLLSPNFYLQPNDIVLVGPLKPTVQNQQRSATISMVMSIVVTVTSLIWATTLRN